MILRDPITGAEAHIDAVPFALRGILYTPDGKVATPQSKATYFASGTFTPVATPTDLVTIFGSLTKTVRVLSMRIVTTNTAAGSQQFSLIKRSGLNTAGTFVAATAVPADSVDAAASATSYGHYTANPSGLGSAVGTINTKRVASPAPVPASFAGIVQDAGVEMLEQVLLGLMKPITLNGINQGLAINFAGAALVAGQTHAYQIIWTEE